MTLSRVGCCEGGERLNAQAAIQIRRQQSAYPPHVFLAALHPVLAAPQSDDGDEPRFMVCDHHETPGEPGYFSERSINRSGQGCVYFVRFIRLGNKLDAESGDPRASVARAKCPRIGTQGI